MIWYLVIPAGWLVLAKLSYDHPGVAGSLVAAGVGATVSLSVYLAGRAQARRQATLELFREYYSETFADRRHKADRFMERHRAVDWSRNDPYVLGSDDGDLVGYGEVLRFWQRVATLYDEGELNRGLTQRLLSREIGYWNGRIFTPMAGRKGMYVRDRIVTLAGHFAIGQRGADYAAGLAEARRRTPPELEGEPEDDRSRRSIA